MLKFRPGMPALFLALIAIPALPAQDDPKEKEPDPEVTAQIEKLKDAIKDRKMERDLEARELIDGLLQKYEGLHEKSQKAFVLALNETWKARPRKPEQLELYKATAFALGTIGGDAASKMLVAATKSKPFTDKEYLAILEDLLENVGRTKDEKQVKTLVDLAARDPEDRVKAASGRALRHFEESSFDVRKDIVKDLLIDYTKIESGANESVNPSDPVQQARKRTLQAIADPWNETLSKLTGETDIRTAQDWQHWWNKNKNTPKSWKNQAGAKT
jgi:hypothetical protein